MTELATQSREVPGLAFAIGAAIAVSGLLNTAGVFTEDAIHWANWLLGFAFIGISAVIVFGWFVRRAIAKPDRAWRAGLVFGLLGLLTVVAFWSGLPPVFAVAGIYLGTVSLRNGTTSTARLVGGGIVALGAIALVLDVVLYASDIATRV